MFETIRTYRCRNRIRQSAVNSFTAYTLTATVLFTAVPLAWASPFEESEIVRALSTPLTVHPAVQDLASNIVKNKLPKLMTEDLRLAKQLGFGAPRSSSIDLDQPLPLIMMHHEDVLKFVVGRSNPLDLLNNTNNWTKDPAGKLIPKRIIYSLKVKGGTSETGPISWSSLTLEESPPGSWRVIQIGAPKLARTMNLYKGSERTYFLLWISNLNRHYLGQLLVGPGNAIGISLTALFDDPLAKRGAGEIIPDVASREFIEKLKKLDNDLRLLKQLKQSDGQMNPKQKSTATP